MRCNILLETMNRATVYVVEDDDIIREVIAELLLAQGERAECFASAEAFLDALRPDWHGCLLLDLVLPGMSGTDLQAELARRGVGLPIVFMSAHGDVPTTVQAMRGGAVDFLTKPIGADDLERAVHAALERDHQTRRLESRQRTLRARLASLSQRERQILDLALTGMQNKEIARELDLSHRTVEAHRARIFLKLGVNSIIEVMHQASELDLPLGPAQQDASSDT
jgi:FixJ family two-component response regulator